jgi:hypothetical protein
MTLLASSPSFAPLPLHQFNHPTKPSQRAIASLPACQPTIHPTSIHPPIHGQPANLISSFCYRYTTSHHHPSSFVPTSPAFIISFFPRAYLSAPISSVDSIVVWSSSTAGGLASTRSACRIIRSALTQRDASLDHVHHLTLLRLCSSAVNRVGPSPAAPPSTASHSPLLYPSVAGLPSIHIRNRIESNCIDIRPDSTVCIGLCLCDSIHTHKRSFRPSKAVTPWVTPPPARAPKARPIAVSPLAVNMPATPTGAIA